MTKKIDIKVNGQYNGHNIKPNGAVDVSLKFEYGELVNYIKLLQLLNENIVIAVKAGADKPKELGMFMLKDMKIGGDGEGVVKFNSSLDYVEADNLNGLISEILTVRFKAEIEEEVD